MAKMGRPTNYNDALLKKAYQYLEVYKELGEPIPTQAGLAVYLGVCKRSLTDWEHKHPNFLQLIDALKAEQEKTVIAGAMLNEFNSTISKLLLTKHGYSDKVEQKIDQKISGGGTWEIKVVE